MTGGSGHLSLHQGRLQLTVPSRISALRNRQLDGARAAPDLDLAADELSDDTPFRTQVELREALVALRARELSLALGTLLIVAGVLVVLTAFMASYAAVAPIGMIGGGVALIRFGGRQPESPMRAPGC